ncbi:Fructokinase-like 2, chloroplastic [Linum grandiflorum]
MASSLSSAYFLSLPSWHSTWTNNQRVSYIQLQKKWGPLAATSRKKMAADEGVSENGPIVVKKDGTAKRGRGRPRKKPVAASADDDEKKKNSEIDDVPAVSSVDETKTSRKVSEEEEEEEKEQTVVVVENVEKVKKVRKSRKKDEEVVVIANDHVENESELASKPEFTAIDEVEQASSSSVVSFVEDDDSSDVEEEEEEEEEEASFGSNEEEDLSDGDLGFLDKDEGGEDISGGYGWPPLVCCFGAAQHAFVPSGRRANRLLNYEIHDRMRDAYWEPDRFMRAPGGCAGGVAVALASLGGKVAFMGKLGDDDFGQAMLYYMNVSKVQTRSVIMDGKRPTTVSRVRLAKRGRFRMICTRSSAEDSLSKSEINIDILREAKMFYFNTHPLLDRSMRSSTLYAMKISKKLGGVIFYDVNLPLPLWQSREETIEFIRDAWNHANVIEVTKQELEFLCGIEPTEEFDTRNNDDSKFVHYGKEVIDQLWHENLQVLFVTNGTSEIHYYTKEHNGSVLGMEDPPLTPFTADMSASGDGIVAGLMRMLTVQPHLITDEGYLKRSIQYAIECGVIDQWLLARTRGFPLLEEMDEVEPDPSGIISITEQESRVVLSPSQ